MPTLHRDYETRSTVSLSKVGPWRYAADSSTEIMCVAYAADEAAVKIWTPGQPIPEEFFAAARDPDWTVVAHNASFECAIEERVLAPRYGWPITPIERHRCTLAAALAAALPGALDAAAAALGLPIKKDADGHRLMLAMSKPRKPKKEEDPTLVYWHEDSERRARLAEYCARDVDVERALYAKLPPLSSKQFGRSMPPSMLAASV
jgi:DNA polymerase